MKEAEIVKQLTALATIYPNTKTSPQMFEVYAGLLKDLDADVFKVALQQAANESENFFPSVATIRRFANTITEPLQLTAADGWAMVLAEVSRVGIYRQPKFESERVAKCVASIGWETICNSEMIGVERAHFTKAFNEYSERDTQERRLLPASKQIRELTSAIRLQITEG